MELTTTIAPALGAAWASSINLYAAVLTPGYMGRHILPLEAEEI